MAKSKEIGFDSEEVKDEKAAAPVLYIELYDKRGSGFILDDGNRGTQKQVEIDCPTAEFIPNFGFRRGVKKDKEGKNVFFNEQIRYIKEQTEISVEKQKELGIVRSRAGKEDMIEVKKGSFTVAKEGSFIGLYDFLVDSFYNADNPNRSVTATKIYRVIELGKEEEGMNEDDILMADAIKLVAKFYQKIGKDKYTYNEEKINALCNLFTIFAETMPGKIASLNGLAKIDPKGFLEKAAKFEQVTMTEIAHALQLNVIQINENTVQYVGKEKIIANLGTAKMSREKQIEKLADLLHTPELKAAYEELQLELEIAQEKQLKS
jgi:hypothetical protein